MAGSTALRKRDHDAHDAHDALSYRTPSARARVSPRWRNASWCVMRHGAEGRQDDHREPRGWALTGVSIAAPPDTLEGVLS